MKRRKQMLAAVLAGAVMFSSMSFGASALEFSDTEGHWAASSVSRWSDYGVVQGAAGKFNPDAPMTRAEMATVLANLLGLKDKADNTFADVKSGGWYEDAILKCAKAGIIEGTGSGADPEGRITREQAAVMLGRALGIAPATGTASFNDGAQVADWAAGYVKALADKGIVNGVSEGAFGPQLAINRASVATILDRSITTYANQAGASVEASGSGITLVAAANVTVTGTAADVLVAPGAADGAVTLKDAKVTGTVTVDAAGASLALDGKTEVAAVAVSEQAEAAKVTVGADAKAASVDAAAAKAKVTVLGTAGTVSVGENAADAAVDVAKDAKVDTLAVGAKNADVSVAGSVKTVDVAENAAGTAVTVEKGATVSKMTSAADNVKVDGAGKVSNLTVTGGEGTTVAKETTVSKVENKGDNNVKVGDKDVKPDSSSSSGSSSSSSGGGHSGPSYTTVNDEPALLDALKNQTYIRLGADITLTGEAQDVGMRWYSSKGGWSSQIPAQVIIPEGKTLVIDLNGHVLDTKIEGADEQGYYMIFSKGNLTINGSTAQSKLTTGYEDTQKGAEWPRGILNFQGNLQINGGTYAGGYAVVTNTEAYKETDGEGTATGDSKSCTNATTTISNAVVNAGFSAISNFQNAKTTVNGSEITAFYYALCNNGTYGGTEFAASNSTLISNDDTAIYFPAGDQLTLDNCKVTASAGGIEAFAGDIVLKNGTTINAGTEEPKDYVKTVAKPGDGSYEEGSAILMGYRRGYKTTAAKGLSVTVDDTVILLSTSSHCIRLFDDYKGNNAYDAANGVSSITLVYPDAPHNWSALQDKALVENSISSKFGGTLSIKGGVEKFIADFVEAFSKTESQPITITAVGGKANEYNVTFDSSDGIQGTGVLAALGALKGLTEVTVAAGEEDRAPAVLTLASAEYAAFKEAVLAKFPTDAAANVDLNVNMTVYGNPNTFVFHVSKNQNETAQAMTDNVE